MNMPMWVLLASTVGLAIGMLCDVWYDLSKGRR